jgi:hypothetical protein
MQKTGRLAGEDQRFVSDAPPPEPPTSLGPAEVELWWRVTSAMPPNWFSAENLPLLAAYCRHCAYADAIAADIAAVRADLAELVAGPLPATYPVTAPAAAENAKLIAGLQRELRALQRTHASESGAMLAVATKLRLTQQSRFQANSAQARTRGRPPSEARPWDLPDGRLE